MTTKCNDCFIPQAVEYIGDDKVKCVYLYADLLEYRTQGENFGLWSFMNGDVIYGLAYRYYDTVHLFSRDYSAAADMACLINELSPKCITGEEQLIEAVLPKLSGSYRQELNHIATIDHAIKERRKYPIVKATESDVPEIAAIMMDDKVFNKVYTYDSLCRQMTDGIKSGKRRVYILRDRSGNLLAADGTYVEATDIVIISGLIVAQKVKRLGFGAIMLAYVSNVIREEGKQVVAFLDIENEDTVVLHKRLGFEFLGKNARLLKVHGDSK